MNAEDPAAVRELREEPEVLEAVALVDEIEARNPGFFEIDRERLIPKIAEQLRRWREIDGDDPASAALLDRELEEGR